MLDVAQAAARRGHRLLDRDGRPIGVVREIFLNDKTGAPEWALVDTGLLGTRPCFAPLEHARTRDEDLLVPYDRELIISAPTMASGDQLSPRDRAELARHYAQG